MTNYETYPKWRDASGIIIEFSENRYSWSENNSAQRKYLLESDYCDSARRIYVCCIKKWFSPTQFKDYLKNLACKERN